MQLKHIPLNDAVGTILIHHIADANGRKALAKGHVITANDIATLRALGQETVYAARLDPGDVREDEAATRLAQTMAGTGIVLSKAFCGRVNFYPTGNGFLQINRDALKRINALQGVTLATLQRYSHLTPRKMLATLKTVGLALPESTLLEADKIVGARGPVLSVVPLAVKQVALIFTGSERGQARTKASFAPPLCARIEALGARVISETCVGDDAASIAATLVTALDAGAQMVILAGETSVMDLDDITPHGIRQAGGEIEFYGAPFEPGSLTLLAYIPRQGSNQVSVPIIGAPGCARSSKPSSLDFILPGLCAGERISRADLIEWAEGGLLMD